MSKKLTCLILALVMIFALTTSALALDTLNVMSVRVLDPGYLSVIAGTDYTADEDMNFAAATENGSMEITDSVVLRNEGTSWFVILEYGNYENASHQKCAERALKKISEMIGEKDDGALIRCDETHAIAVEKSAVFKETLTKTPRKTDAQELANTVRATLSFIDENIEGLMPNVAIIIVTACPSSKVTDYMIDDIGNVLSQHSGITTHIVVTAGESVYREDRDVGQKLIDKAKLTVGGTGYVTESLKETEADRAIQRINDSERRKILMVLDPQTGTILGKKLTLKQTTAGGKELKAEVDLPDALYTVWEESFKGRVPDQPVTVTVETARSQPSSAGLIFDYTPPEPAKSGMSTELLIGIIVGAVVLILLAVLLILRAKQNKGKKASAPVYTAASTNKPAPAGTTITLLGSNGATLKGTMKNNMLTVGRSNAKAMVTVPNDGKLSSLHATFTKQGNGMMITDNGSTNGTKVNGNKLSAGVPTILQQNDTVTMGSTTYTVSWH